MFRSGWRYVFTAIIGLSCLAASPPQSEWGQKQAYPYQSPRNGEGVAPSVESPHEADDEKKPCQPGVDNRKSDLCAQWKAADAAADSARWTRLAFWASLAGLGVGLATLAAAIVAAKGAWDAARYTAITANEAKDANLIARNAIDLQSKPSFYLEGVRLSYDYKAGWINYSWSGRIINATPNIAEVRNSSVAHFLFIDEKFTSGSNGSRATPRILGPHSKTVIQRQGGGCNLILDNGRNSDFIPKGIEFIVAIGIKYIGISGAEYTDEFWFTSHRHHNAETKDFEMAEIAKPRAEDYGHEFAVRFLAEDA